jgi:hypothetical protein
MASMIPNIAKGRFARDAALPLANDQLYWVLWTGAETDANIRDSDHLAAMEALALAEVTAGWYSRQVASGVTVTVDDTNDRVDVDANDPSWSPTTAVATTRISLHYEPDTTAPSDSNKLPIFVDDFAMTTPTSGTIGYTVAAAGFARAA